MGTQFSVVYERFLSKITDDMYLELTPQDTLRDLQLLLINAIPGFEFPRKTLSFSIATTWISNDLVNSETFVIQEENGESQIDNSSFEEELSSEEINILAILMLEGWVQRQVSSIENTRMKYSGSDFKMTSQANHLAKLLNLLSEVKKQSHHMQRLYKRRKTAEGGEISSNWGALGFGVYYEVD